MKSSRYNIYESKPTENERKYLFKNINDNQYFS